MRIRSIKPEFWRSQDVADLPRDIRLLWIGLWSYVDDNGVGIDDHRAIAADLFAFEDDPNDSRAFVREGLATLSRALRVTRYTVSGVSYIHVTNWEKHQRIDRPNKSRYPLPPEGTPPGDQRETAGHSGTNGFKHDTLATPSRDMSTTPPSGTGEQGNRGTGEEKNSRPPEADDTDTPLDPSTPSKQPTRTNPTSYPQDFLAFWDHYPRKEAKKGALKSWRRAIKDATPETIIEGAKRYAAARDGQDPKFHAMPTTWLNQGRWDDEPPPAHTPKPAMSTGDERIMQIQAMKDTRPPEASDERLWNVRSLPNSGGRTA